MSRENFQAIVIGGSAGSLDALSAILPTLPADFALPVMVVVHLPADKKTLLPQLLSAKCQLEVREAEDKENVDPGTVYLAPPDYHLLVETNQTLSLSYDEPLLYSRPSIDVLFESAADAYGENLIGIILSGANSDGARGLKSIDDAGGMTIVQSPETSYSTAMPLAALAECPRAQSLSLAAIAELLNHLKQ